jgi:putative transposase
MADTHEFRRRKLPHWDVPGGIYFVTTCLEGSISARGLSEIAVYRAYLAKQPRPADLSEDEWEVRQSKLVFARTDEWLDGKSAVRWLEDPALAQMVLDTFWHFAGERYDVFAMVVMPSHLHWVFRPRPEWAATLSESDRTPREASCAGSKFTHPARATNS